MQKRKGGERPSHWNWNFKLISIKFIFQIVSRMFSILLDRRRDQWQSTGTCRDAFSRQLCKPVGAWSVNRQEEAQRTLTPGGRLVASSRGASLSFPLFVHSERKFCQITRYLRAPVLDEGERKKRKGRVSPRAKFLTSSKILFRVIRGTWEKKCAISKKSSRTM